MSSSRTRSFVLRNPVVVDIGCNCRRTKFFSLFSTSSFSSSSHSKSKSKSKSTTTTSSSITTPTTTTYNSSSWDTSFTTNSLYEDYSSPLPPLPPPSPPPTTVLNEGRRSTRRDQRRNKKKASRGRVARESVAVAVESNEPYEDFRESMVQMIVEKNIYAWDDLNDLLHQFLSLNSPRHHPLIIHAFADLWNGLFSPPSPCL